MELARKLPLISMPALLVLVELGALLLSLPMKDAGISAFEDPSSVANPLIFIAMLLIFTAFLLLLIKYKLKKLITIIIGASIFFTFLYTFNAIALYFLSEPIQTMGITLLLSVAATAVLYFYPEWYVIDTLGVLIAAGAASIFGISLELLPVIILLVILAIYDAISVYKTRHMITLAEGVVDLKTPILFVIPKRRDYSYRREGVGNIGEGERAAYIIGMGDLIMPSILVVSANMFLGGQFFGFINLPSLGAIVGSVIGLVFLLSYVQKGKAQAGLPPINGGVIVGFLLGYGLSLLI
ncbi:MAG TPA: presenilin family intramembrane aspartyl protease PSH [Methanoregulaceae archaeon]|nr:presenilin family intramembrane aspartyl protease PSH [Methanoregulaceae archaeon]